MTTKKTFALLMAGLCMQSAMAQTEVEPFVPGATVEGVCYYLPATALRVTVTAEKTVTRPGQFNKYANRYLRLDQVPESEKVEWELKEVKLEPYGVPDRSKAYSIKLKSKTVAPLVGLSRDGLLLSINTDAEETLLPEPPQGTPAQPLPNPKEFMTQEILSAGSTAKQAELCAQEIYDIRESRNALIRGEADNTPKDGAQLKLMLEQLDRQASVLESLFRGTIQKSTEVYTLSYVPQEVAENHLLFRFSRKLGVLDADDLAGEPVFITLTNLESVPEVQEDPRLPRRRRNCSRAFSITCLPAWPSRCIRCRRNGPGWKPLWASLAVWRFSATHSSTKRTPSRSLFSSRPVAPRTSWNDKLLNTR